MAWSDVAPSTTCRDVLRADPYSPLAQRGWHAHPRMRRRREARPLTIELHGDSRLQLQKLKTYTLQEDRGAATFRHLQHHASGRAASSAVPNHVYG